MSDTVTEAFEALLVRYEHELNSLQTEDFFERIPSWLLELNPIATGLWSSAPAFDGQRGAASV
ncbi:hypothetical protein [Steroidobacter agaridevorans]|nr:hypothetical protein [Steroidobacter agaridevorans]